MLSLVVEAVMFKGRIVNSGTSLVWKVAYYGLAAAGVICLSLLGQSLTTETRETDVFKVLRDLGVMVAEIEYGTLVFKEDANYALLTGAARTIKNLTARISLGRTDPVCLQPVDDPAWQTMASESDETPWDPWYPNNLQDFESSFWLTLAEHPLLLGENLPQ
ncbi:hypothetical protein NW762_006179 [Fusarium torreyae]|uniref:Uncharacterized protein n=1 Tax=Fusarium torreyae TaxID=1237075 RepID=A0A9W8VHC2_9HYPO|nr:hypothetical protein NW762_006179 [Fusarium torreyae]